MPAIEVDGLEASIVQLDPVRAVAIFISKAIVVAGQEFRDEQILGRTKAPWQSQEEKYRQLNYFRKRSHSSRSLTQL